MDIQVRFPGGKQVDASFDGFTVRTDQAPARGGEGSAPEPFDLFLASLATCAGAYALGFCQARGLSTDGMTLVQRDTRDAEGKLASVEVELTLPPGFPEKYRAAIQRTVEGCKVKKTLLAPPDVSVRVVGESTAAVAG